MFKRDQDFTKKALEWIRIGSKEGFQQLCVDYKQEVEDHERVIDTCSFFKDFLLCAVCHHRLDIVTLLCEWFLDDEYCSAINRIFLKPIFSYAIYSCKDQNIVNVLKNSMKQI